MLLQQPLPFTVLKPFEGDRYVSISLSALQQPLPFTVLKQLSFLYLLQPYIYVATALTVYGIETPSARMAASTPVPPVATALTVYGIETAIIMCMVRVQSSKVATALTVYGIETLDGALFSLIQTFACCNSPYRLRY